MNEGLKKEQSVGSETMSLISSINVFFEDSRLKMPNGGDKDELLLKIDDLLNTASELRSKVKTDEDKRLIARHIVRLQATAAIYKSL